VQTQLDARVKQASEAERGRAGAPRLVRRLKSEGCRAGRNLIAASLRRQGLRARAARKFKATTSSNHGLPVAEKLLQQDFTAQGCDEKCACDASRVALYRRHRTRGVIVHSDRGTSSARVSIESSWSAMASAAA
jgi:transposase InsO family protein